MLSVATLCGLCGWPRASMYVCDVYILMFVCVPTGNIFSATLRLGPGEVELWWPLLPQAAKSETP